MDNFIQIKKIREFRQHLSKTTGKEIDMETAARIWVRKYAKIWRLHNNSVEKGC